MSPEDPVRNFSIPINLCHWPGPVGLIFYRQFASFTQWHMNLPFIGPVTSILQNILLENIINNSNTLVIQGFYTLMHFWLLTRIFYPVVSHPGPCMTSDSSIKVWVFLCPSLNYHVWLDYLNKRPYFESQMSLACSATGPCYWQGVGASSFPWCQEPLLKQGWLSVPSVMSRS